MRPSPTTTHEAPLALTLARGRRRRHAGLDLGAQLYHAGATGVVLDQLDARGWSERLDAVGAATACPRRDVQASLLLEAVAWAVALPLAGALVAEARVPLLSARGPAVVLAAGTWPERLVLRDPRFAALPGDAAASHDDARVVGGDRELARGLAVQLDAVLRPAAARLAALSGRPLAALWRSVGDRTSSAFLVAGLATERSERAHRFAGQVLHGLGDPAGPPRWAVLDHGSTSEPVHLRHGCCLVHRLPGGSPCVTCPLARRPPLADRARWA